MALHVRLDIPPVPRLLEAAAEGLVETNVALFEMAHERGVDLPPLYDSGIVYRPEPPGREWWETARDLLDVVPDRSGDCEDLAAYRAAECRFYEDDHARVVIIRTPRGSFHAVVEHEDGELEDPSRIAYAIETANPHHR
jgi:hypothetical protein